MRAVEQYERLEHATRPLGGAECTLVIGDRPMRIEGLSRELGSALATRWGKFLVRSTPVETCYTVQLLQGGPGYWLGTPESGEVYRVEAMHDDTHRLVASYNFAIGAGERPGTWRVGITDDPNEMLERILDNVMRLLTARLAVEEGGFAMHAAGVLHDGRAWLFGGASRTGKSTVVRLLAPAKNLGDDFGLVLPARDGLWSAPAVPFDNSERVGPDRPRGLFPVAGIWRLHQAESTWVEPPPAGRAVASLMGCTAFPRAMPELSQLLLENVERFVKEASYNHLHFTKDADLWSVLV
jgi:hypothetical protein